MGKQQKNNNFNNYQLECAKWFNIPFNVSNSEYSSCQSQTLTIKAGIGKIPFGRPNSGNLEVRISIDNIELLINHGVLRKDKSHLEELKTSILQNFEKDYWDLIRLDQDRAWMKDNN